MKTLKKFLTFVIVVSILSFGGLYLYSEYTGKLEQEEKLKNSYEVGV